MTGAAVNRSHHARSLLRHSPCDGALGADVMNKDSDITFEFTSGEAHHAASGAPFYPGGSKRLPSLPIARNLKHL